MLNRTELEYTHTRLLTYRDRLTALIDSMASFLALDAQTPPVSSAVVPPVPPAAEAIADAAPVAKPRAPRPSVLTDLDGRILAALHAQGPLAPGVLSESLQVSRRMLTTALERLTARRLVTLTGATIKRVVTITEKGRAQVPSTEGRTNSPTVVVTVADRDAAIKARLKVGPATFEELLEAYPGTYDSDEAKRTSLSGSLRRLSLRSEVLDAGNQFKLRAA